MIHLKDITTDRVNKLPSILDKYGVAILENYFTGQYADEVFDSVKKWLIDLDIGLTNDKSTWLNKNLPLGPRYGMHQSIISNAPKMWELRENFYSIFQSILGEDNLLTSIDGASFFPTKFSPKNKADWAHIDQTISSDFMCYQAQFIASDTDAIFVCTPKSHKAHAKIIKKFKIESKDNWYKFTDNDVNHLQNLFGENYQVPIHAKKGSVILWDSRTIHSAKYPNYSEDKWRAVFYISMRSKTSYAVENINTIQRAVLTGKTTNHWGNRIFNPFDRFKNKNPKINLLIKQSEKLSYYGNLTQLQRKLCDFDTKFSLQTIPNTKLESYCILDLLDQSLLDPKEYHKIKLYVDTETNLAKIRLFKYILLKYLVFSNNLHELLNFISSNHKLDIVEI